MSSYKPKKLDELNKIYDKTITAQRAIQKGASKIKTTEEPVAKVLEQPADNFIEEIEKPKSNIDTVVVTNPSNSKSSVKINVKKINPTKSSDNLFEQSYLEELVKKRKEADKADELARQEVFAIEEAKRLQGDVIDEPEERESQEVLLSSYLEIMSNEEKANKSFSLFKKKKKSKQDEQPTDEVAPVLVEETPAQAAEPEAPIIEEAQEEVFEAETPIVEETQEEVLEVETPIVEETQEEALEDEAPIVEETQEEVFEAETPIVEEVQEEVFEAETEFVEEPKDQMFNDVGEYFIESQPEAFGDTEKIFIPIDELPTNEVIPPVQEEKHSKFFSIFKRKKKVEDDLTIPQISDVTAEIAEEVAEKIEAIEPIEEVEAIEEVEEVAEEIETIEPVEEIVEEVEAIEPVEDVAEIEPVLENDGEIDKLSIEVEAVNSFKEIEEFLSKQAPLDGNFEDVSSFSEQEIEKEAVISKKSKHSRVPLIILMVFTMLLTIGVGILNSIFTLDSNVLFDDKFYVNVASQNFNDLDISNGDLVFSAPVTVINDEIVFSYVDYNGSYLFAVKLDELTDENGNTIVKAQSNSQTIYIEQSSINGCVKYTIPLLGTVVLFIQTNAMMLVVGLFLLVLAMLLILCFGFKDTPKTKPPTKKSKAKSKNKPQADQPITEEAGESNEDLQTTDSASSAFDLDALVEEKKDLEFEDLSSFSN